MKIRKSLSILGHKWTVKKVRRLKNKKGQVLYGECDYDNQVISLNTAVCETLDRLQSTFIHELFHAVAYSINMNLEEEDVKLLEIGWHATIRDNKLFDN